MPAWLAPAIAASAAFVENRFQAREQRKATERMNEYNKPANQMKRYQEAGLNANLIYGQGNPGNQTTPTQVPDLRVSEAGLQAYNQTRMIDAQVSAANANTAQKLAATDLIKIKTAVEKNNPLLNVNYLDALIASMQASASIKASEADIQGERKNWFTERKQIKSADGRTGYDTSNGYKKLQAELSLLEQRFNLGTADQEIKAQVLTSKEFQNAILEVQQKFMTDADITPQHIVEFAKLILMRLMSK